MNIRRQSGTFQFEEEPFSKNVPGIGIIYHEVLSLMNFLRTKPQVRNMNINYYDLYYTVIKNRDVKEIVDNNYENGYNNFNHILPNHYIGRKNDDVMLRRRN